MSEIRRSGAVRLLSGAAVVTMLAVVMGAPASAGRDSIKGRYEFIRVTGPACTSPANLCGTGTLTGSIKGTFTWTVDHGFNATVHTTASGVMIYLADMTVRTDDGEFTCEESGAIQNIANPPQATASLCVIQAHGTGRFAGNHGWAGKPLQFVGQIDETSGAGTYVGDNIIQ